MTTTISTPILALDLGKYKIVACLYDPSEGEAGFQTLPTTRAELARLLDSQRRSLTYIPTPNSPSQAPLPLI